MPPTECIIIELPVFIKINIIHLTHKKFVSQNFVREKFVRGHQFSVCG